jgi:hypothetical protein
LTGICDVEYTCFGSPDELLQRVVDKSAMSHGGNEEWHCRSCKLLEVGSSRLVHVQFQLFYCLVETVAGVDKFTGEKCI